MKRSKWFFIPLSIIIFICLGTVYSWSVFKKPLEAIYNINSAQSNLPYMFFLLFYALLMPVTGSFIEKYGPRITMGFGGILVGIGWILSAFAPNIFVMTITYGVIAGAGVGIAYGGPIATVSKWFPKNNGIVVGTILGGFGLSPFITAPLANHLINTYNPFVAFRTLGIIFLIVIIVCSIPFKFPKSDTNTTELKPFAIKDLLNKKLFWGLWSCYIIGTLIGLMMIGITSPVGQELIGLSAEKTALLISVFAVFNALGRPLFGWLTDKLSPLYSAVISFILILAAGAIILIAGKSLATYIIAFALFWLNLGGWLAIAPTATASFFGAKNYSKNYGIIFTAYGIGAVLGGLLSGNIKELFGSYHYVFFPVIVLAIIGIISSLFLLNKSNSREER